MLQNIKAVVRDTLLTADKESDLYRLAEDWLRQHNDLCRAWRNRTGSEIFSVRKFACAVCSEKDTGLVCGECIATAQREADLEVKEESIAAERAIEEMANE